MLTGKQAKCLKLMIEGKLKDGEIAKEIGVTQKTICEWKKNNEEFQDEFQRVIRSNMQFAASKAFKKQVELLESRQDMVAHLAAKDIMDRAGFQPTEKIESVIDMDLNITVDYGDGEK